VAVAIWRWSDALWTDAVTTTMLVIRGTRSLHYVSICRRRRRRILRNCGSVGLLSTTDEQGNDSTCASSCRYESSFIWDYAKHCDMCKCVRVGGVAQWLGRRSLATGWLFWPLPRLTGDHSVGKLSARLYVVSLNFFFHCSLYFFNWLYDKDTHVCHEVMCRTFVIDSFSLYAY